MPATRYVRRNCVIRVSRAEDGGTLVKIVHSEHVVQHQVPRTAVERLLERPSTPDIAHVLWQTPEILAVLVERRRRALQTVARLWRQARSADAGQPAMLGIGEQLVELLCLKVDDNRLLALPLERALGDALFQSPRCRPPISRLVSVPPRVAQTPFTLPLRLLQLDPQEDFDLPRAVRAVFGTLGRRRNLAPVVQVGSEPSSRFAGWTPPGGWKTVDVLQLDRPAVLPVDRLFRRSSPGEVGTLGWLTRCVDLWRTRLVVMRAWSETEVAVLRQLAHVLAAQGGPAVWVVDRTFSDTTDLLLEHFYNKLIHDAPLDVAVAMAVALTPSTDPYGGMMLVGAGREELLRVSAPGGDLGALASGLRDPDPGTRARFAGQLWSTLGESGRSARDTAAIFARTVHSLEGLAGKLPSWNFDVHEGDGMIPLGDEIEQLRQVVRTGVAPPAELRATRDRHGPRFVNPGLWRLDPVIGRTAPITQDGAHLRIGEPIVLGVQLGPRDGYAPVLDAVALIEEPFKWQEGRKGVWLSIGVTELDFVVIGAPLQEVWLPRHGASDIVEFTVEPKHAGVCQLRFCVYFGADLLQSHRLAALVTTSESSKASTPRSLASALGVTPARVGVAGWLARMEYAAATDLAAPPAGRDVALSIFANNSGGRRVYTVRGSEGYEVLLAGDSAGMAADIRDKLDAVSRDEFHLYAFREREAVPLHTGTEPQRDTALHDLAHLGWTLFAAIFANADRTAMAADLAGERRIIHVAHKLLENVIPWAAIYDRPYDLDRTEDDNGRPILRGICPAGLPDAGGRFRVKACGTHPDCPLSPQGRAAVAATGTEVAEDTLVCARHFWGFRHIVELPPYQTDMRATPASRAAVDAPPRWRVTSASDPASLLLGYNAVLDSAAEHRAELQALLAERKLRAVWSGEIANRNRLLAALRTGDVDLVYLFCHARGGLADPKVKPPALELQEAADGPPGLIRAAALAKGLRLAHHPLVILNGCNTAVFSPDALSPFIRTLVRDCEAAGALGTEIPVFELLAGEVARQFLTRFLDGEEAGAALLDTRLDLLARGNPLGLIYTLYAVAELTLTQGHGGSPLPAT